MLRVMEPQEPYNTKEDLLELAQEYKETKQNQERDNWKLARLAQEAAQKYDLKEFAKQTGEVYQTLRNLSYVASKYTEEDEKYYGSTLVFKFFIVAAASDNRLEWLKKAQDNAWSAARLGREMNPPKPVEKKEPVQITSPQAFPILPVENTKPKSSNSRTLEEIVEVLNWYLVNDKRTLELAASNALIFMCLLLGEDKRTIVFDEFKGEYVIQ